MRQAGAASAAMILLVLGPHASAQPAGVNPPPQAAPTITPEPPGAQTPPAPTQSPPATPDANPQNGLDNPQQQTPMNVTPVQVAQLQQGNNQTVDINIVIDQQQAQQMQQEEGQQMEEAEPSSEDQLNLTITELIEAVIEAPADVINRLLDKRLEQVEEKEKKELKVRISSKIFLYLQCDCTG